MSTELSGLELRKAACEALGWVIEAPGRNGWDYSLIKPCGKLAVASNLTLSCVITHMPEIESDTAVALPMLVKFCATHGSPQWEIAICKPHDAFLKEHITVLIFGGERDFDVEAESVGSDAVAICEAISRALVAASKGGQ